MQSPNSSAAASSNIVATTLDAVARPANPRDSGTYSLSDVESLQFDPQLQPPLPPPPPPPPTSTFVPHDHQYYDYQQLQHSHPNPAGMSPDAVLQAAQQHQAALQATVDAAQAGQYGSTSGATTDSLDFSSHDESYTDDHSSIRDYDSAIGESILEDDTTSINSYITDYIYENGRRYHAYKEGAYWGPNDESAADIIDLAHHMYNVTMDGKLHYAPLHDPKEILDVGTGTGIWAMDMADKYPNARVTGTDLSAIQPEFVPPNCFFDIDDARLEWAFQPDQFDFVHVRELFGCIPDWDFFFAEAYKHIKPGGWIEVVEHSVEPIDDHAKVNQNHFYTEWGSTVMHMGELTGCTFGIWREAKTRLKRAGFVDVTEVPYKWPMNAWSRDERLREIGKCNQYRLYYGVEGFMLRLLTRFGQWSESRAQVFLKQMRDALRDYSTKAYLPGTVVYARKPLE